MNIEEKYEFTGGIVNTPEQGRIEIPPEKTGRKGIVSEGELVIRTEVTPERTSKIVRNAKRSGITEIPAGKIADRDEGR